ncbi:hypothetical protein [Nocardioides sp. YR527]|uniref:hypothetical protein n=1 Tax=Nocardioides sp. YR527 TaxID=1881028 RepID=UPI000B80B58E|nr:hypothetical protein [Nocardioides sp. YR527]
MPAIATLAFLVIWGVLVWVAVGFGADARGGDSGAWAKLAVAAVVAVACLFLTFTFAGKAWRAFSGSPTTPPTDDYTGSHSNAYVEEQDYSDTTYSDQQVYSEQAYPEQDYYGTGSYGYDDTGSYGRHSSDTGSQPPYGDTGNLSSYTDTGSQSPYGYPSSDQGYGNTGSRAAYSTSSYLPPTSPPPSPQPYYSSPPTPTSTPQSTSGYSSQGYGTDSYPTQQAGSGQYQSGTYQTPTSYEQTGSRARLTQDPAATQAMPAQRQPQSTPVEPDDEWPPRHNTRNKQWPPAEPDTPYRGRH